ncbi:hypothetical protein [Urbifossiella limnaea]|uniref:Uncharacterized protein n=1 Tax=Urbifossiella limnaea TaxID=2528023 RepID=A0A517XVQ1_9BACT|nr:hypothetical protein [Urbifossiella limnaea]QDU21566.1 hypothetical protein ETAA1_35360 [Urbifossiella limnaea]
MKRLTVLALTATVVWGASFARAADPLPLPTGLAPTTPRVPAPVLKNGSVVPIAATAAPTAGAVQTVGFRAAGSVPASDWSRGANVWCSDCAPAVRHPLPPAPVACATGTARGHDGSCWEKFKSWLCFRETPIHLGLTPTPRAAPQYTYFPCTERAGCAAGNCGPGGCAPGHPRLGGGLIGGRACTTCPTPGESVMPGFRFANPTAGMAPPQVATTPASGVVPSGFRTPAQPQPAVPYRATPR